MFFFALSAWLVGIGVSFAHGGRKLPVIILLLGIGALFAPIMMSVKLACIAVLAAIIWLGNKVDTARWE
jgi:hypothetical protein